MKTKMWFLSLFITLFVLQSFFFNINIFAQSSSSNFTLQFDGRNDYVEVPHHDRLNLVHLTIEAWVKPETIGDWNTVLMKTSGGSWTDGFGLSLYSTSNTMSFFINHYDYYKVIGTIKEGKWSHIAGTYDGEMIKLFINGALVDSTQHSAEIYHSIRSLLIGKGAGGYHWKGNIDEVRIWDIALSEKQIKENMYKRLDGSQEGFVAYWRFDEGEGETTFDVTQNGNDGNLINSPAWVISTAPISDSKFLAFPKNIDFNSVALGESASDTVKIRNIGSSELLSIHSIKLTGEEASSFSVENTPFTLESQEQKELEVVFSPNTFNDYRVSLEIESDCDTGIIELFGTGIVKPFGMSYLPYRDNEGPDFGIHPTIDELSDDIAFIGNLTSCIRTYGVTDNLEQIPLLCEQYKIDSYPGAWISHSPCENKRQIDSLIQIGNMNLSHVKGLVVGSQVLLKNDISEGQLIEFITRVKASTNLLVGTAETWRNWLLHPELVEVVDIVFADINAYQDGIAAKEGAVYVLEKYNELKTRYPDKTIIIGETGWPSAGLVLGDAVPSEENQRRFFLDFITMADSADIEYFYFEVFDEKWRASSYDSEVGAHLGLYHSDGSIKPMIAELVPKDASLGIARPPRKVTPTQGIFPLYVYTEGCDPRNGFFSSGWMGELETILESDSSGLISTDILDELSTDNPHSGETCIRISYIPSAGNWGGVYWQYPVNNWGAYPGYDLSDIIGEYDTITLSFWARGQNGGETVEFISGGIYNSSLSYRDSYGPIRLETLKLENKWKQYIFDLTGEALSNVIGGFAWILADENNSGNTTFYLDNIVFDNEPPIVCSGTVVSGTITGDTWTKANSPYCVVGDILVENLNIEPGVNIIFTGHYKFEISGQLKAIGTEQDSIRFTKSDFLKGWDGIYFNEVALGSELAYCRIEKSSNSGIRVIDSKDVIIRNSSIVYNSAPIINSYGKGGGIYAEGDLSLKNCDVSNNSLWGNVWKASGANHGGGIYTEGKLELHDCTIENNSLFIEAFGARSRGSGIYVDGTAILKNCIIRGNSASVYARGILYWGVYSPGIGISEGGGIYLLGSGKLENCVVAQNSVRADSYTRNDAIRQIGGGMFSEADTLSVINCNFVNNVNDGFRSMSGLSYLVNSIIYFNSGVQVSDNVKVLYSCIENGFKGEGNMEYEPEFNDGCEDMQLTIGSPCIGAGVDSVNIDSITFYAPSEDILGGLRPNPTYSNPDMGAYESIHAKPNHVNDKDESLPKQFALYSNYPNPFNPKTTIRYDIPRACFIKLEVFNIKGQKIKTLVSETKEARTYYVQWDGLDDVNCRVASGLYFFSLKADEVFKVRKMALIR